MAQPHAAGSTPVDPRRVAELTAAENERFASTHPRSRELFERARAVMPGGVPMSWMVKWPGEFPVFVAEASGAHFRDVDGHDYVDLCLGDTGAMTGHSPAPTVATVREQVGRGITAMLPDRGLGGRRGGAPPAVRAAAVAVHPVGHRRQPARDPLRPARHRPAQDRRARLLLPRQRRRDLRDAGRRRAHRRPARQHRPAGRPGRDDLGGRVQRRRGAGASPGQRRGRRRAGRAGADQRRHRAAGPGLPRRAARADPAVRRAAGHRRDAHAVRRARAATPARTACSRTS